MHRIRFEKTGRAVWMSHLDLMRLMQRAFRRAGVVLHHSQGFTPHAYVSMLLPLSVGMASRCEILDFTLEEDNVPLESLPQRLNPYFPTGIRVLSAYDSDRKIKELRYLQCNVRLEYDHGAGDEVRDTLNALFQRKEIPVEKRSKKGMTEVDIKPMISTMGVSRISDQELELQGIIAAQNPSLNPQLLVNAISRHAPECSPDFSYATRIEVYDEDGGIFR